MSRKLLEQFVSWAHGCLEHSDEADSYLTGRGVLDLQRRRHRLGFVPGDYVVDPSKDPEHGKDCGDWDKKSVWCDTCRFRSWTTKWVDGEDGGRKQGLVGRKIVSSIVLPLTSYSGQIVGVQTRSIQEKVYDTFVLKRRPEAYFFGTAAAMDSIWAKRFCFFVEGSFDHLTFERLVCPNVLAITTSSPGRSQARFMRRFLDRIFLCFDEDAAGRKGTHSFFEHSTADVDVVDVRYPRVKRDGADLHDFWRKAGDAKFTEYFKQHYLETETK